MHRSRIGVFLIDHPTDSFDTAADFWAAARGCKRDPAQAATEAEPYELLDNLNGVMLALQRTGAGTPPRVHLDIEADDVPAEVARVQELGATVVEQHDSYAILADPGGMIFCVVPVQTGAEFDANATTWD